MFSKDSKNNLEYIHVNKVILKSRKIQNIHKLADEETQRVYWATEEERLRVLVKDPTESCWEGGISWGDSDKPVGESEWKVSICGLGPMEKEGQPEFKMSVHTQSQGDFQTEKWLSFWDDQGSVCLRVQKKIHILHPQPQIISTHVSHYCLYI